jgi:hypothetical protein
VYAALDTVSALSCRRELPQVTGSLGHQPEQLQLPPAPAPLAPTPDRCCLQARPTPLHTVFRSLIMIQCDDFTSCIALLLAMQRRTGHVAKQHFRRTLFLKGVAL